MFVQNIHKWRFAENNRKRERAIGREKNSRRGGKRGGGDRRRAGARRLASQLAALI